MSQVKAINFEEDIFDTVVSKGLFYDPKIIIKPAHLANGFFRAVCGCYTNSRQQHQVLYPKKYPDLPEAFSELEDGHLREILYAMLNADGRMYSNVSQSSYTSSHISHITSDNHDRKAGEWLVHILAHDNGHGPSPALGLIRDLLTEDDGKRSDELSVLTLPLASVEEIGVHRVSGRTPRDAFMNVENDQSAQRLPYSIMRSIRKGFDQLAEHDQDLAVFGGKLDILRRMVVWGCFSLFLHMANVDSIGQGQRLPMLLSMSRYPDPTFKQASVETYQWVNRSVDAYFRDNIHKIVTKWVSTREYGDLETDKGVESQVRKIEWKKRRSGMLQSKTKRERHMPKCLAFYRAYRSGTANQSPSVALANALADMLDDQVLSATPKDVARDLGVQIGLVSTSRGRAPRFYTPSPDFLDVLVRASMPPKKTWKLSELASYWAKEYGLLFGALGDENEQLQQKDISAVAGNALRSNAERLADMLISTGYAKRYADGVVLVTVQENENGL